LSRNLGRQQRQ